MPDIRERATAYKLSIGNILNGNPMLENEKLKHVEFNNKQVLRVNIVANVIEKYESEGEKKHISFILDDASGQIKVRAFADNVDKFKGVEQGQTLVVIGLLRHYNGEIYVLPEVMKQVEPRYLLVRKLELEKSKPMEVSKEAAKEIKDKILDMIKAAEDKGGLETDQLIMELKADPNHINQEIQKLIESGSIYEPRPGKLRFLG
jgi:RPA family protein